MLNRQHHILSQMLLFNGCLAEEEIKNEIFRNEDEDEDTDIEELVTRINRWNERAMTSLQIESYQWIDNKIYYGWRTTVSTDPISTKSINSLNTKQLSFWKIFLNVMIQNSGLSSLNAAHSLNRAATLGVKYILTSSELLSLFKILEKAKYIQTMKQDEFDDVEFDEKESEFDENIHNNQEGNKYYIIGPRSFIDLKVWIESKTEHGNHECVLCSDYVMYKGFECQYENCPNIVHEQCIKQYLEADNDKCPSCQNPLNINNIDDAINEYVQILNHPNDAIKFINNLQPLSNHNNANKATQDENHNAD